MSTYWATYAPAFTYNPQAGFVSEFTRLARQMGWGKRSAQYRDERALCFQLEILIAFGDGSNIEKWQMLCEEVGIEEIPTSIKQCRKVRCIQWLLPGLFLIALWSGFKSHLGEHCGPHGVSRIRYTSSPISITEGATQIYPRNKNFPEGSCES